MMYALLYLAGFAGAVVSTPAVARVARRLNLMDRPGLRKVHTRAVPRLGGIAVMVSFLAVVVPLLFVQSEAGRPLGYVWTELVVMLAASVGMGLVGLFDDLLNIRARWKLLAQISLAAVVCAAGIRVDHITVSGLFDWQLGLLSWPISMLWIVGVTNAMNLIDGLDGLAAGIAAVTCGTIAVVSFYTGEMVMGLLMLVMLGSLSGFLIFNYNPAKIFLGDCGSNFLGFLLASGSILCAVKTSVLIAWFLPVLALGLPILDTLQVMLQRTLERRPLFAPDRRHLHHRLLDRGFSHRRVVLVMHASTILAAAMGLGLLVVRDVMAVVVLVCAFLPLGLVVRVFGGMQLGHLHAAVRKNRQLARTIRQDSESFQQLRLRLREAKDEQAWWQVIRRAGRFLGFSRVRIVVHEPGGDLPRVLSWTHSNLPDCRNMITMNFQAHPFGPDRPSDVTLEIALTDTIEAAGRRLTLFGRLLDEQEELHPEQAWGGPRAPVPANRTGHAAGV